MKAGDNRMNRLTAFFLDNLSWIKTVTSTVIAGVGGFISSFLGGFDSLLITFVTLIVIDYVTGVVKAVYQKKLSSSVGFRGIIKKVFIFLIVGLAVSLQNILPEGLPLREMTILFFIANEGFSILENAAGIIPLPEKLRDVLAQIQSDSEKLSENDEDKNK